VASQTNTWIEDGFHRGLRTHRRWEATGEPFTRKDTS
jgi:hypothetical protein